MMCKYLNETTIEKCAVGKILIEKLQIIFKNI